MIKQKIKQLVFAIVATFIFSTYAKAQVWCPPGATWYYSDYAPFWYEGYVKFTYTNDTVIKGITCKKITNYYEHRDVGKQLKKGYRTPYFTYAENGVTYIYDSIYGNKFDTLFNINAKVGDKWRVPFADPTCKDSTLYMVVNKTGTKMLKGVSLKWICVGRGINWCSDTIVERFGYRYDVLYYENYTKCHNTPNEGADGKLRCYSDDSFGSYSTGESQTCDFVTSVKESKPDKVEFRLYPNPANDKIKIQLYSNVKGEIEFKLFDLTGRLVQQTVFSKDAEIPTSLLDTGVYTYTCTMNGAYLQSGKISVIH